jgi:hypothetical protein
MRAGALSLEAGDGGILDLRWGGLRLASSIHVTVRDRSWGTMAPELRSLDSDERDDGFTLRFSVEHGAGSFAWRGTATGRADGLFTFTFEGEALRPLSVRRVGICVLHPWDAYVGAKFQASGGRATSTGVLPRDIGPQPFRDGHYVPLIPAFTRLAVELPGSTTAVFELEGEPRGFELEDQRNWTDASFKTYPTPLALSEPRAIAPGDRIRQRLDVRVQGPSALDVPPTEEVALHIGSPTGRRVPPVGVGLPDDAGEGARVRAIGPGHLRTVVSEDLAVLDRALEVSAATSVPLEVWSLLDDDAPSVGSLERLREADVVRVFVLRRSGRSTGAEWGGKVRDRLPRDVPLGGGTWSHFSEVNRSVPDVAGLDLIGFCMTPAVHDDAEASMVETLEIQTQVVEQAARLCGGLPIVVAVTMADASAPGAVLDPRLGMPFAAAWTAGSAAALVDAGVSALSMHEALDRAVPPGSPLERALELVCRRQGEPLIETSSSDPRRARAIAVEGQAVLVANLTPRDLPVRLHGSVKATATMGPYEVDELARPPR